MPPLVIESADDPRLAPYRDIRHRDPVDQGHRFIAEGKLVVERLLESSYFCESILVEPGHHQEIVDLAQQLQDPPQILQCPLGILRELVGYDFHRGILACGHHPPMRPLSDLPQPHVDDGPLVVIWGVNNPENIGGLMRTAAAFGVRRIAMTYDTAHPYSRRALRVSMAAALRFDFYHIDSVAASIQYLSSTLGYRTLATTLSESARPLANFHPDDRPVAVLVGSEAEGLPEKIVAAATDPITIPMRQQIDSLNANVATAIFLYEITKPRG